MNACRDPRSRVGYERRGAIAACLALAFLTFQAGATTGRAAERPNIVLIVADDLGWRDVGYHGSEIRTPNIDRLAASGVKLERHYVWPTCSPTRTALLTGRNPSRFDVLGPIAGRSTQAIPIETLTMADVLKGHGFSTAIAGKWHLGLSFEVGPRQFGFLRTYGYLHGQVDPDSHLYKNGDRTWHRGDHFVDETGHATDLLAAEATRWVELPHDGPFFLYLPFSVPHVPLREDDAWVKPYEGVISEPTRRQFAAAVTHMDAAIGRVVASLEKAGLREKTLILFTSDNGGQKSHETGTEYGGKYGPYPVLGDNRPLRGWKGELFEGGIRVPAFVNWPGMLSPRTVDSPVSALDWLPTLAALTGGRVDERAKCEGLDIWPLLTGEPAAAPRRFYWKTPKEVAVRQGDWKLIVTRRKPEQVHLFNLSDDPGEVKDLARLRPDRVAELRERLATEMRLDPEAP